GKITEADLERARDMQQRLGDKRRLGEILVSLDVITQREVERQVRFQIEEVVFEVMSWNEGYFSFNEEPDSKVPTEVTVRIPVEALLMEGARRIDEWSRIENRIPHVGVVPSLAPPPEGGGGELDLLLSTAHRQLGFGRVAMGRFGEAVASWDQWDRLAGRSPEEESQRADVERARQAARVFVHG